MRHASRVALVLSVLALDGCAVGFATVRAPDRLPPERLPALPRRLTFDVCSANREELGARVREALSRAGVEADLVSSPGMAAHFTVTQRERRYEHGWSMALALLTFSIIPGYAVERHDVEVRIGRELLVYERGVNHFVWAPFVVHPDFVSSIDGGWESARYKDMYRDMGAGFERTVQRLADDLRSRFGREAPDAPPADAAGVTCFPAPPPVGAGAPSSRTLVSAPEIR